MAQYLTEYFSHPLAPVLAITLAVLLVLLSQRWFAGLDPSTLQKKLGADGIGVGWFWFFASFWIVIFLLLFAGLVGFIVDIITAIAPTESDDKTDWRFVITKVAALTAVMGALIAFPFTMVRLTLLRRQTDAQENGILIDRMNSANEGLGATLTEEGKTVPNIAVRVGAIMALERISEDTSEVRNQILKMLNFYIVDRAKGSPQETGKIIGIPSDVQAALNTSYKLCELINPKGNFRQRLIIDLRTTQFNNWRLLNSKFSYCQLNVSDFTKAAAHGCLFKKSHLRAISAIGANFTNVTFDRCLLRAWKVDKTTKIHDCKLFQCALQSIDLSTVQLRDIDLSNTFGDQSVTLPDDMERPSHWHDEELDEVQFNESWSDWKATQYSSQASYANNAPYPSPPQSGIRPQN